jgi:hypothetical protein
MQSPRPVVKNMAIDGPFIDLGKFDHDRSLFSRSLEIIWFFIREIIPFCHKIQDPAGLEKSHHPGDRKIGEWINITKK